MIVHYYLGVKRVISAEFEWGLLIFFESLMSLGGTSYFLFIEWRLFFVKFFVFPILKISLTH